jgi:hypothetical protein
MKMTSTFPEISLKINPWRSNEVFFEKLLTAMRARASRFANVIELDPPQQITDGMLYCMRKAFIPRSGHVGVTGADFPKLKKVVWWTKERVWSDEEICQEALARLCFDKPDLEVDRRRFV